MIFWSNWEKTSVNLCNQRCRIMRRKMQQKQQNVEICSGTVSVFQCSALTELNFVQVSTQILTGKVPDSLWKLMSILCVFACVFVTSLWKHITCSIYAAVWQQHIYIWIYLCMYVCMCVCKICVCVCVCKISCNGSMASIHYFVNFSKFVAEHEENTLV